MYSWSSRCIRNGIQARPDSIQITGSLGKRSPRPLITQLVQLSTLYQVKPSAWAEMKRLQLAKRARPVDAGMEGDGEAALLHRAIDFHVSVVVHAHVGAHGGHHEAADVLAPAEGIDVAQGGVGIAKRQAQQREEPAAGFRHYRLGKPAI